MKPRKLFKYFSKSELLEVIKDARDFKTCIKYGKHIGYFLDYPIRIEIIIDHSEEEAPIDE